MNEMFSKLQAVIDASGLWRGDRAQSHKILLSPSVYRITVAQRQELECLGIALRGCLQGLSHIAVIAHDQSANHRGMWQRIRQVFTTGVPSVYHEFQGMRIRDIPRLLKLDLMVDIEGQFKIAEIDGHNKHGVGYSTLGMKFRDAISPESVTLPGVAKLVAEDAKRMKQNEIKIFYADQERFYIPEFEIAQREIESHGVACRLFSEMEATTEMLQSGLFLDLPFLYRKPDLYQAIGNAYKSGNIRFIIPPKPFLGAKGVLALLRNDEGDKKLEAILHSFIDVEFLESVRRYIPFTVLLGKQAADVTDWLFKTDRRYILKESISSGMKGTVFSTDADYEQTLKKACLSKMNWILQEEVVNQPQTFSWFEGNPGLNLMVSTTHDWFMRVTAQYVNGTLGDLIVTARRDKAVHGGKDCIQLGTIVSAGV